MKLSELVKVTRCGLHLIDITRHPYIDCGVIIIDSFNEFGDVEKYKDYKVKNIYTHDASYPNKLRVEISEK